MPVAGGVKLRLTVEFSAAAVISVTAVGISIPIQGEVTFLGVPAALLFSL
ncbi:MAG: hypothetical protein ACLSG8_01670 [Barnesiella sp.]